VLCLPSPAVVRWALMLIDSAQCATLPSRFLVFGCVDLDTVTGLMSVPLSDKARGKRRAADDAASESASSDSAAADPLRTLVVRFSEGEPDLRLAISTSTTVRDVKTQVRT
jgi:hypothetical protein